MTRDAAVGRHVLVTGAAGGIGAAVCRRFAHAGDRITAVDCQVEGLRAVGEYVRHASGMPMNVVTGDLADEAFAERVMREAWQSGGPVDVAVMAAGIYPAIEFLKLTPAEWDRVQQVNVRSVMQLTRRLAELAIEARRSASIVHISSGAAQRARAGAAHYSASKAALEMLTRSAALELGPHYIRVNAVSPGFVDVGSSVNPVSEAYARALGTNPLGRPGRPEDIAAAVYWLASDDAAWVSGTILRVDGGASAGNMALPLHWPPDAAPSASPLSPGDDRHEA